MSGHSYSVVEYYAEHEYYKCGYCKSPDTNSSYGMWAHSLTVQDYQNLIDRGWRRSGCYCYKPIMDQTCCPMYTIKCEALHFKISKSQKKILKHMTKFLRNELKKDDVMDTSKDRYDNIGMNSEKIPNYSKYAARAQRNASNMDISSVDYDRNERLKVDDPGPIESDSSTERQRTIGKNIVSVPSHGDVGNVEIKNKGESVDPASATVPCKKAKILRVERKKNKLLSQGKSLKEIETIFKENKRQQNHVKSLEELFDEINGGANKLEIKLVGTSPRSSGYLKTLKKSYELYKKYETTVHGDSAEKVTEQRYTRFLARSPLQMKLVRVMSAEFHRTLDASANLYKKYQMTIHEDPPKECDRQSFINFLVKSPLQPWYPEGGPAQGYGSFHEQYWLNNELIAVGVIDILPSCVSSVYFFYDPAYSHLSLGTFSSLREIYLTRQLNKVTSNLKYYYMGFYIHTCPKMRYKARMKPSYLLCPETYTWCDIESSLVKLDKEKYSRLNDDIDAIDEDGTVDIDKVLILHNKTGLRYETYKVRVYNELTEEIIDEIKQYASLVGSKCAQSLLLYRN